MSKLGSLYIRLGEPEGELTGCCETAEWACGEIESLRQQLAERETRLEEKTAECLSFYNEAETVIKQRDEARQQLAAALAACKVKDEAIVSQMKVTSWEEQEQANDLSEEALAIQPDGSALKAWLGDPVACRNDGRCQYAIDHGAEGLGHCPEGKCCMPLYSPKGMK